MYSRVYVNGVNGNQRGVPRGGASAAGGQQIHLVGAAAPQQPPHPAGVPRHLPIRRNAAGAVPVATAGNTAAGRGTAWRLEELDRKFSFFLH